MMQSKIGMTLQQVDPALDRQEIELPRGGEVMVLRFPLRTVHGHIEGRAETFPRRGGKTEAGEAQITGDHGNRRRNLSEERLQALEEPRANHLVAWHEQQDGIDLGSEQVLVLVAERITAVAQR